MGRSISARCLFVGVVLSLLVGACSGDSDHNTVVVVADGQAKPAYGDAIVEGSIGDASNLIPMLAGDSSSHQVAALIFDGLVTYDPTLSYLEPRLARDWTVSEDGLQITFQLRDDVRWQDGTPFTARDIEFGFNTITDPDTLTAYAEDYRQVERFEVLGDHSFRVSYRQPFAPALASWGNLVVLPRHILEGRDINQTNDFSRNPVGLGAYKFESWETASRITLLANHDYYRGRPYIEKVVYRIIPDLQTQFLELKSGGLDMMGLTPLQFSRQTSSRDFSGVFEKYRYLTNSYTYLGYNLRRPLFQDVRVRRALSHAIDKDELVSVVLLGLGRPARGPYKPGTVWENLDIDDLGYDPQRSRQLLAEAGWSDSDGDGTLDKDGESFEFRILTNQGNENRMKTATIIQRRFQEVGVKAEVRVIEWSAFINNFVDKRDFDAVVLGWSLSLDPDQYDIWHSSKTSEKEFNFISFSDPEVDGLLEKGRRSFDQAQRKAAYDRFQEILVEQQPYTFLYVADALPAVHRRFHAIEPRPAGIAYNFKDWYVPDSLQRYSISED
ncbi:MAG: peptide-binding protein [Deltaproteobacteria bacterium]